MFNLMGDHLEPEIVLQLEDTPGLARLNLLPANPKQEQIGQNGDAKRLFDPIFLSGDLMLSQPQPRLYFVDEKFHRPPPVIDANHLPGRHLGQIGHDEFGLFRAHVTPFFAEHHHDVTDMIQRQAFAIDPEGLSASLFSQFGYPGPLVEFVGQMRHQILQALAVFTLPRPSDPKHESPTPLGIFLISVLDHLHILFGAIGCISSNNDGCCPPGRLKLLDHLPKQRIFCLVIGMLLGQDLTSRVSD